jgi:demethylmenaquinone methyltransferase / 2-methoxy-6-polyprenyl-1,4-benzoquinol methylase
MTPSPSSITPEVLSPAGGEAKRSYVRRMFTAIAPRYDLVNRLISGTLDQVWRRSAVRDLGWESRPEGIYLDLCAGTLDLSAALARRPGFAGRVVGVDFVLPMLKLGRGKADRVRPLGGDALHLPFRNATFDGAMVAWGIRNLADPDAGLAEVARVLRPGARFVILEFAMPRFAPLKGLFLFYFRRILPAIGRLVSRHENAYTYLPETVLRWPTPGEMNERMRRAGFRDVGYRYVGAGICAVHYGHR